MDRGRGKAEAEQSGADGQAVISELLGKRRAMDGSRHGVSGNKN